MEEVRERERGEKKRERRPTANLQDNDAIDKSKPDNYFQFVNYDRTRGHSMKLAKTRSRLDMRKNFCSQRVVSK